MSSSGNPSNGTNSALANIPTSNAYESLNEDECNEDEIEISDGEEEQVPVVKTTQQPKVRIPPIYVTGMSHSDVFIMLNMENIQRGEAKLKLSRSSVQILCKSKCTFDSIITALKVKGVKFFTHNTSDNVPVKFVLSGLPLLTIPKLTAILAEVGVCPLQVKVLSTVKTDKNTHALYLVYFKRGTTKIQDLRKQAGLLSNIVATWRYFVKRSTDIAQCHRCQRFGHGSSNCYLNPLCVKCGEQHLTNVCTLPTKDKLNETNNAKSQLKCANCGGSHTANYRGCPKRKSYLESLEQRKNQAKDKASGTPPPRLTPFNFPSINGGTSSGRPPLHTAGRGTYADTCKPTGNGALPSLNNPTGNGLFTVTEFLSIARNMYATIQACQTKQQQVWALMELVIKYLCDETP